MAKKIQFQRDRNGSLYDRGGADYYYDRPRDPHWYPKGTYKCDKVLAADDAERDEYNAGYDDAAKAGTKKNYG